MLLAADTSGKNGSVALARVNPGGGCDVLEVVALEGGAFSAQLIPQVISLLKTHHAGKLDIGGFAVASGPGSFTGLRVGLAAVKALAEALNKPIASVSLLEAVAVAAGSFGLLAAVLDAGRGDAYVGRYRITQSGSEMIEEKLIKQSEIDTSIGDAIVTPDPRIADAAATRGLKVQTVLAPRADSIAQLGWKKILAGHTVPPETLDANYIRRSDAEIFSKSSS